MSVVKASHVYKVFGKRPNEVIKRLEEGADRKDLTKLGTAAVIDASFEVEEGEIFVVMGLSGSGKSTLIRTLNGLWAPTAGSVEVLGTDISKADASTLRKVRGKHVSMVFQHFALLPHRTVRENAAYSLEIQGVPKNERADKAEEWLKTVGLDGWGDKYPQQLSGGMQQRVGLARALAAETDILLMDEAFSALDPLIRREMQEQLVELQRELKKTIIFITHDLNEAMFLGDRIAVMRDGRIVQIGTSEEILTQPADDYIAEFVQDVDRTRVLTASSIMRETNATISIEAGPRLAMRTLEDSNSSGLLVLDENRTVVGMVSDRNVVKAAREGQHTIADIVEKTDLFTVRPETPISELFAPSSTAKVPLTVVDDNQRLLGIVPRVALLNSMADPGPATGEIPPVREESEPVVVSPGAAEADSENGAAFTEEQVAPTEVAAATNGASADATAAEDGLGKDTGSPVRGADDVDGGKH
ncbi:glycine betaine/proline transport system ATP-binding protein [Brevibacterium iodinum ATCC 49514]|uniref:Glycine betaine/proline transport system ATP-binding protein n=1 Tax=Brevibacterium iodinum ATCC 49514 TaxID=1255616 RepID=A0A2H1JR11_9MICO|nr:glycine betaine/L-proline ABC transporter ATP-binding protein [Brevibacterium iodinum]SMX89903.1 glycine betaine/proline transport system ATP-binding protein [Brevibacterium iodinum ATCC 49514]SUW13907.1 Glycine betaine/L-proline transport ATP-binding protein ProV [Brevibacterium iodinum]